MSTKGLESSFPCKLAAELLCSRSGGYICPKNGTTTYGFSFLLANDYLYPQETNEALEEGMEDRARL
jgi:hypothetical protein